MDSLISIDEARTLVADAELWPYIRDFLWDFAPQVHPTWLEGIDCPGTLISSPRIKKYIISTLAIKPCFHAFPKDDFSRLLLLDCATLESIAKWIGTLASAESLRRVTAGATVRELKSSLPGIYPEVFGYTAYFKLKAGGVESFEALKSEDPKSAVESVVAAGWKVLFAALSHLPESLLRRFSLKLPKSLESFLSGRSTSDDQPSGFDANLIFKLLKLKFPEAYALCCS